MNNTILAILFAALAAGVVGLFGLGQLAIRGKRIFALMLFSILIIYVLMGRGGAYLGVAPLYISEMTLGIGTVVFGLALVLHNRIYRGGLFHVSTVFLLLFMVWGALRTLPFIPTYGMSALRDAVIWGYAIFAIYVAALLPRHIIERGFKWYGRLLPYILFWLLFIIVFRRIADIPNTPGSSVSLVELKAGDIGVHLGGAAAYLLLRLDRVYGVNFRRWQVWAMWLMWGAGWVWYGSLNRGGMLSAMLAVLVVLALRPIRLGWLRPASIVAVLLAGLLLNEVVTFLPENLGSQRRPLSLQLLVTNITSTFGVSGRSDQLNTRAWRLEWWSTIVDYTVFGDYFVAGKGYGINLAQADGFPGPVRADGGTNRHPHNVTMNVLARSGVVGLALWLAYLATFGWRLFRNTFRPRPRGATSLWLMAYWLAFLFNAQVDVFFEGPMGGVWFWSLTGAIMVYSARRRVPHPAVQPSPVPSSTQPAYDSAWTSRA